MSIELAISKLQEAGLFVAHTKDNVLIGILKIPDPSGSRIPKEIFYVVIDDIHTADFQVGQFTAVIKASRDIMDVVKAVLDYFRMKEKKPDHSIRIPLALAILQGSGLIAEIDGPTDLRARSSENLLNRVEDTHDFMRKSVDYRDSRYTFTMHMDDAGWSIAVTGAPQYTEPIRVATLEDAVHEVREIYGQLSN